MISPLTPRSAGHPRPVAAASVAGPEREAARSSGAAGSIRGPLRMQKVATGRNRKAEMTGSRAAAVGADICSPHPDAVRRRREAEARYGCSIVSTGVCKFMNGELSVGSRKYVKLSGLIKGWMCGVEQAVAQAAGVARADQGNRLWVSGSVCLCVLVITGVTHGQGGDV